MKKYTLVTLLCLCAYSSFSQDDKTQQWKNIIAQNKKDTTTLAALDSIVSYVGNIDNDSIFYYVQKLFDLAGELHNPKIQWLVAGRRLTERYFEQGKIDSALQLEFKAATIFEAIKDSSSLISVLTTIGNAHKEYGDYTKAIYYYNKGYQIATTIKNDYGIYTTSVNLGYSYAQKNHLDSALYFSNLAYEHALKPGTGDAIIAADLSLGVVHNKLGHYGIAKSFFLSALDISNTNFLKRRFSSRPIIYLQLGIATSYEGLNMVDSVLYYARIALQSALKIKYLRGMADAQKMLAQSFYSLHNLDSAYFYRQLYDVTKDSLFNRDRSSAIESITFEQNQKERERQAEILQQAEERQHNIQLAITAIGILSAIILFLLLSRSIIVHHKVVAFLNVVVLLVVFEFINLLLHPFLEKVTHHSPVLMLLGLVVIAALIVPMHHKLEHWANNKLVEKNKAIRLANAKKTIEELEQPKNLQ